MNFGEFKVLMQEHFKQMSKDATHLFEVELDKDVLWNLYLDSYPDGKNEIFRQRREHDCSCCRHFVKNIGNVAFLVNNKITTIWDFETGDTTFQPVINALSKFVKSQLVSNIYVSKDKKIGTNKNYENCENGKIIEWEHLENLTDESSVEANFTGSSVSTYISDNALSTDTDINVPVGIRSNSSGGIILNNIDFNLTLNQIGAGSYANNLTNIALNNGSLLLACTTEDFGRINIEDYTSRYLGDGNFTITAHLNDTNSNLTENITYRIIQARFSPINFSYPAGIESLRIAVNNGTQYNVTPIGQFINYCTSANITQGLCANMSIPFYNFSTDAKLDPVNITGYLNETLNSCITMRSRVNVTNPLGEITWNITEQTLISGAAIDANHSLFIDFDFVDCNLTTLRAINFTPIFNSYCEECIY